MYLVERLHSIPGCEVSHKVMDRRAQYGPVQSEIWFVTEVWFKRVSSLGPIAIVLGDFGRNTVADLDVFHQMAVSNYLRVFSGATGPFW